MTILPVRHTRWTVRAASWASALGVCLLVGAALNAGCSKDTGVCTSTEFVAQDGDFGCVLHWPTAQNVHFTHRCGENDVVKRLLEAPSSGMRFPVGTILQAMPMEAMVKRGGGFDPDHGDWEYFVLAPGPAGTKIVQRGTTGPFNVGGRCTSCHYKADDHDNVCGMAHQCPPSGVRDVAFVPTLYLDPRCLPH